MFDTIRDNWQRTILNQEWLEKHEADLRALYPQDWKLVENFDGFKTGASLKKMGVLWNSPYELSALLVYMEKIKIVQRSEIGYIRANPNSIFERQETNSGWKTILR